MQHAISMGNNWLFRNGTAVDFHDDDIGYVTTLVQFGRQRIECDIRSGKRCYAGVCAKYKPGVYQFRSALPPVPQK